MPRHWRVLLVGGLLAACTFPHYNVGKDAAASAGASGAGASGAGASGAGASGAGASGASASGASAGVSGSGGVPPDVSAGAGGASADAGRGGTEAGAPSLGTLASVDLRGDCRGGKPDVDGETEVIDDLHAYDVTAYGSEMGHHCAQDQGRFVYLEVTGDFDVAVQISAMDNFGAPQGSSGSPVKAGLMARESLETTSRYIGIWAMQPIDLYPDAFQFDFRKTVGGALGVGGFDYGWLNKSDAIYQRKLPNIWVRLTRSGGTFSAYASEDGSSWQPPSTASFSSDFGSKVYVGLAQASAPNGSYDVRSLVSFRNLSGLEAAAAE